METPFDEITSNQNLQILKLILPYTPPETQRFLAVYVKFSELQYTMDFFQYFKKELHTQDFEKKAFSPFDMIQEIQPYLPKHFSETLDKILNILNMLELFETLQEMPGSAENTDSEFDPVSMMKNMLPPEQQSMFDMYNTMFAQNSEIPQDSDSEPEAGTNFDLNLKGDDSND